MSFRAIAALLGALAGARLAAAADLRAGTLELDPSKTRIEFRLDGTLHATHGTFKLERGVITADPYGGTATGMIEVDAKSGDTGIRARDDRMKDTILETQKYPQFIFEPRHIEVQMKPKGQFHATLQGVMAVHGSAHPMTLEAEGHISGDEMVASSHFSIPYVDWGMADPSLFLLTVAKHVDVDIAAAGRVFWAEEPATHR
jgi:polyisoprenoid-binding protein YceI